MVILSHPPSTPSLILKGSMDLPLPLSLREGARGRVRKDGKRG